ncbi:MAG: ATP-binding cassette domain-containing protein, partial [Clostridia bacterium]|nr:ATP-binding cassette domain-containing protein [Clostridia bacterium]
EVMEISDVVAVLRKGRHIKTVRTKETTPAELTEMMVGRKVDLNISRLDPENPQVRLSIAGLTVRDSEGVKKLDNVGFVAYGGEILGIAGIAGSGQKELLEAIAGLRHISEGTIVYSPEGTQPMNLVGKSPMEIRDAGVAMAFVPEDRLGMGLVGGMGMTDNMMLRTWNRSKGIFVDRKEPERIAKDVFDFLEVSTPGIEYPVRKLSGGNVQKVLVGREIATSPSVLMTAYAVRGLDINTSYIIYDLMCAQKAKGVAVIYVGEDLDVLLALCDKILVLCGGRVSGLVDARKVTKEEIGLMMTSLGGKEETKNEQ